MRKFIYLALMAATTLALVQSCSKSSTDDMKNNGTDESGFDRKVMLTNISTNIIIPAYASYQTTVVALDAAVTAFNAAPDAAKLTTLQSAFKAAYIQWQSASEFNFGPAADANLGVNTNTYPTTVTQINANVTTGVYKPDALSNLSAKGLPALDYLLFGTGADNAAIPAQYTTDANAANRKTILAALSAELKTNINTVVTGWNGAYKTTFVNAVGTDVASSTGIMINQLVYDYELLKNQEIGIPAGIQSAGATLPAKVQGYYAKMSVQLVLAHVQAIQNLYLGKSMAAGDGIGLDEYLVASKAKYNGGLLNDAIKAQFTAAIAKLQVLTDPLSTNITTNNAQVTAAYTELQKLTVLLKTDMTSSLGILITFGDNDGD